MAKQSDNTNVPKVTSLPLPSSDSVLVIDLPDGQKLLVGKMESGSVIEVATWRGTGRPDSRTNRLMLGMSNGDAQVESEEETSSSEQIPSKFSSQYLSFLSKKLIKNSINFFQAKTVQLKGFKFTRKSPRSSSAPDFDVEDWLKKIKQSTNSAVDTNLTNSKKVKYSSNSGAIKQRNVKKPQKSTRKRAR